MSHPGDLEQLILLALLHLEDEERYGARIRRVLSERAEREVSYGSLYTTLARMESKGYLESSMGNPTRVRGGRRPRLYRLTATGEEALGRAWRAWTGLAAGLEPRLPALGKVT